MTARIGRWTAILRLARHVGGARLAPALLVNVLIGLAPAAFIVAVSVAIAKVPAAVTTPGNGDAWAGMVAPMALAAAAFVLQQVLVPAQNAFAEAIVRRVDGSCVRRLMSASLASPMTMLERQEILERLGDARGAFDRVMPTPGDAVAGAVSLVGRYTQLAAAVALVATVLGPLAGLVVLVTALVIRFGQRGSLGRFAALWEGLSAARRKPMYLRGMATTPQVAKEARILGLLPWLRRRHEEDARAYLHPLWTGRRRILFRPFLWYSLVGLLGGALVLYLLATAAARGQITLLDLSIAVQAVLIPMRFGVYFPEADIQTQYGLQAYHSLVEFERESAAAPAPTAPGGRAVDDRPRRELRFEGVTFGYGQHTVLNGLDLEFAAGRSTAIVGLNGAGKTTLVKLLAGLYRPQGGRVLVDGDDLSTLDQRAWQRRLAVIFQDYVRYELSAAENIELGAPELLGAEEPLRRAAERAGALEVVSALPDGFDTPLSRQYRGGAELSGGQWQRIALARAFFAVEAGASVLVLDEPTAQLDVRAEVEFFDRFLDLTRGLTTIVISHRFSTVRRADRIVVLAGGVVAEHGTHDELLAGDGQYARLFRMQAQRFAADVGSGL